MRSERFGVIFCDPPFFNVSLSQLSRAIRVLAQFDFTQPVAVSHLTRRREAVLSTFAPFTLQPMGFNLTYRTVKRSAKNQIELFANFATAGPGGAR